MHLSYVGNKPVISHTGIDFSIGKEDKYIYVEPAAMMLEFLGGLEINKTAMLNPKKVLDEHEVFSVLHKYRPGFDAFYEKRFAAYKEKLADEISEVDSQERLSEIEKEVLKKNLQYMQEYRLQRVTNKLVYEELINASVELIKKKGIGEINMPFSLTFLHVASSFESSLRLINRAVVANVEVMMDKKEPYTRIRIHGFEPH